MIPIDPSSEDLFSVLEDGIILCKLINLAQEGSVDLRALNRKSHLNIYETKENLNLALSAAKGIGCRIPGIFSDAFIEKKPHLILAVLWQILKLIVTHSIDLKHVPELMRLCAEGEELSVMQSLQPEQILVRWVNFHLAREGVERRVANLGKDLADSFAYTHLLHSLDNSTDISILANEDLGMRSQHVIETSTRLGVPDTLRKEDIVSGNSKLNTLFVSAIFNNKHGLE